jgi:hypothetical protein
MALLLAVVLCVLVIANAIVATHLHYSYFGAWSGGFSVRKPGFESP